MIKNLNKIINDDVRNIKKYIGDNSIDLLVTDPPYPTISGGKPNGKNTPSGILSKNDGKIFEHNDIDVSEWMPLVYDILKPNTHAYIMVNTLNLREYLNEAEKVGFKLHNVLIWDKGNATPSRWYMKNVEYILFFRKGKAKVINNIGTKQILKVDNIIGDKVHPTEKPVKLMDIMILNSSQVGDTVLDPFMGSAATAISSLKNDRNFIGLELDKIHYDKSIDRIETYKNNKKNKNKFFKF